MHALELWRLKQLCRKLGVDYHEIDSSLSYWENKEHLLDSAHVPNDNQESLMAKFQSEHFLTYYVTCILDGDTRSEQVGQPLETRGFSLAAYIEGRGLV